jgi:adenylate cyclase class IV
LKKSFKNLDKMSKPENALHKNLELELKFLYDFDLESKLEQLGAVRLNPVANEHDLLIKDEYFDNLENNFLILNDCWLRTRTKRGQTKWQLKYPSKRVLGSNEHVDNYIECEDENEIRIFLTNMSINYFHKVEVTDNFQHFLFNSLSLKPFCLLNSKRKSYLLDEVRVDLDETDFGFNCGELEVMMSQDATEEQIQTALKSIRNTASKLGKLKKTEI